MRKGAVSDTTSRRLTRRIPFVKNAAGQDVTLSKVEDLKIEDGSSVALLEIDAKVLMDELFSWRGHGGGASVVDTVGRCATGVVEGSLVRKIRC